jgi:PAS domain S-box-containing protein
MPAEPVSGITAPEGPHAPSGRAHELAALYRLTDSLYRARSLGEVYDAALDGILNGLGCTRASVLLFDEAGVMRFVAWRGLSTGYRSELEGHSPWKPGERDPHPILVRDIADTDEPAHVKARIREEGISGLAFIPLVAQGGVIGKFMTYYDTPHDFTPHEIDLAVTIARQIGFSLERARAELARRLAEEELRLSEEQFRLMSEHAPVMIWTSDAQGRCLHLNSMLRAFWNVDTSALADFDWQSTIHIDDAPLIRTAMSEAVARRSGVTVRGRYRDASGRYRILETNAQPQFSAKGEFRGMIGVNIDVTDRELAERTRRENEERFRLAVEAAPSGMVLADPHGRILLVNAQAEKLFGYARDEIVGQPIEVLVPERFRGSHPAHRASYGASPSSRPMGAGRDLFALRKDGCEIPVEIGLSLIHAPEGPMTLAAVVDVSERKRADQQRDVLLAELSHRVKNTLTVVQSIAFQTFRDEDASVAARSAFEGRLAALAAAHNLLTQANWGETSLRQIAADAMLARSSDTDRISVGGPDILLEPRQAVALALALHELYTNAVKHGALSRDEGRVALHWARSTDQSAHLRVSWREQGGPPVTPPARRGFGTRLVERALARDLDATVTIDFRPEGVVCLMLVPLRDGIGRVP